MTEKSYPVLAGGVVGASLVVWCPYCCKVHSHGHASTENVASHRVAHCEGGPLKDSGYLVRVFTKKELKDLGLKRVF